MKYIDQSNYMAKTIVRKKKPSLTVAGQSYSIEQVVQRLRAGLPVQVLKSGFNPDGFPKFDDLTSLDQFKAAIKRKEAAINEKIEAIKAKKAAEDVKDDKAV